MKISDLKNPNSILKRQNSLKFSGVMLGENILWQEHIKTLESKLSKNISLLYGTKKLLNTESLRSIYFSIYILI